MSDVTQRIANLPLEKRDALLRKLAEKKKTTTVSSITPQERNGGGHVPLSFAQQRLWFLEQLSGRQVAYNLPTLMRLEGDLNTAVLHHALNALIQRHEILRTTFPQIKEQPVQHIIPALEIPIPFTDLTTLPYDSRAEEALQSILVAAERQFDLVNGPLIRAYLYRLDDEKHLFFLNVHHIIFDGWSADIFFRELAILYTAFLQHPVTTPLLPPLPLQYADYAIWQKHWLQGEVLEKQLAYWKSVLAGPLPELQLPTDHPRTAVPTFQGASELRFLSSTLTQTLKAVSSQQNTTPFMLLMTAFNLLLHLYTGQDDLLIGFPIANRNRAELEPLIGFFINTLVLRTNLAGNPTFAQLLEQIKQNTLAAYDHQDLPFERLVEELHPSRTQGNPIFQVMFDLQTDSAESVKWGDLTVTPVPMPNEAAKFDLTLAMADTPNGLVAEFEYNVALFDAATIQRMAAQFETLLTHIAANPTARLSDLPLLTPAESHQLLVEWNETTADFPHHTTIHQLFETQAHHTPNAVALIAGEQHFTYRQLNERANQLACYLRQRGVGPETIVAICCNRSLEMGVALLAVLKAGGAYLPLDPAYPDERLTYMLQDSGAQLLLTHASRFPAHNSQLVVVDLQADWPTIAQEPATDLPPLATPDNLAYVIYTSGSTGQPKGVMALHRGLVNYSTAVSRHYALTPADRVLQFASFSFDVAAEEFFPSWLAGTAVILRSEAVLTRFTEFVQQEQITVLNLPATFWQEWVADLERAEQPMPPAVRLMVVGSEKVSTDHFQRWQKLAGEQVRWINVYGPTEATIGSTFYEPTPNLQSPPSYTMPIGRPIPNAQLYILDKYLNPAPIGVPGELYIGGAGVARGYLNRPGLTAEKFLPNPFEGRRAKGEGRRAQEDPSSLLASHPLLLYRTGDTARYLPDGTVEFLGRVDQQVKIRGFRVELGEIEAVLRQHSAVSDAAVVFHQEAQRLVAYLVCQTEVSDDGLRAYLRPLLADYMIPATFVRLPAFPRTPNDKLDYRALSALEVTQAAGSHLLPRTPMEEMLAGLWAQVLGVEKVGIYDNFFALGGHSLLGVRLVSRIQEVLGLILPLHTLFTAPTLAELATAVSHLHATSPAIPPIQPRSHAEQIPLSFAQQRLWFFEELTPGTAVYNVPMAMRLTGPLDIEALEWSCSQIIRRHEILRTTFTAVQGIPQQIIHPPVSITIPLVDLSHLLINNPVRSLQEQIRQESDKVFDLVHGPLVRFQLLRLNPNEHVLLFITHHMVFDGWSSGVFFQEFTAFYEAFNKNEPASLPAPPIQYADYAIWQQEWLKNQDFERQMAYWKNHLSGQLPVLQLPTDRPRPAVQSHRGGSQPVVIPANLMRRLRHLSQNEGVTLYMTLLAAFYVLLYRYTQQADLLVGTPIANRNQAGIEGLIGFFVNTLVMRADLSNAPTFTDLLKQVRQATLEAYAHQDLPFEHLVAELQPERSLGYNPIFQVMFALENTPAETLTISGLQIFPLDVENRTAKFDLTLSLYEVEDKLLGEFEYSMDLFDALTIKRMLGHWLTLLEGAVADPQQRVDSLPLLTALEWQEMMGEWNRPIHPQPAELLHQLFEQQVEEQGEETAVLCGTHYLTYRQLNEQANQLAHYLQQQGIGAETVVAVLLERSLDVVVALLGIWKAGGAYLPLDPAYPSERLALMLADSQPAVVLTNRHLVERLTARDASQFVFMEESQAAIAQCPITNPYSAVSGHHLAYIIYTSGSTGQPKGVMMEHGAFANHCQHVAVYYGLMPQDVVLQFSSFSFDTSLEQIAATLITGAKLVVREEEMWGAQTLQTVIVEHGISVMNLPTAYWYQLLQAWQQTDTAESKNARRCVRLVMVGGEAMSLDALNLWLQLRHEDERLINVYGPTETAVTATGYEPSPDSGKWLAEQGKPIVPIGRPIGERQIYICDLSGQPVPVGIPGELCIGGANLARGYLNQPELTAERFVSVPSTQYSALSTQYSVEKPLSTDNGPLGTLYRTGDLARYLPDGNIEFLGRADTQVKIRGFRVELGEIEAVLRQNTAVQDAVVLMREDTINDKKLVAYLVSPAINAPTIEEIRTYLQAHLPDYMIPTAFVWLPSLPLNVNGKVDRAALPPPDGSHTVPQKQQIAPRDPIESTLATIWQKVLGIKTIGVTDDYFELGGHSLQALALFSQIEARLGINLPVAVLFQASTIAEIAQIIRQRSTADSWSSLVAIQPHGNKPPFFCVHGGAGHIFGFHTLSQHLGSGQPFYGLQPKRLEDGILAVHSRVEEIAAHYIHEMRTVQPQGPYHLGGYCFGGVLVFEMAQQLAQAGQEVAVLAMLDPTAAFTFEIKLETTPPPESNESIKGRVERHSHNLAGLSFLQKVGYVLNSGRNRVVHIATELRKARIKYTIRSKKLLIRAFMAAKRPIPRNLRELYFSEFVASPALKQYTPRVYKGKAILFRADWENYPDPTLGWGKYVTEGVELFGLPTDHLGVVREPNIATVADILHQYMEQVS